MSAGTLEEEIHRVKHIVSAHRTISDRTTNIVLPERLDPGHDPDFYNTERLTREEWDPDFYSEGLERLLSSIPVIEQAVEKLAEFQEAWGFQAESVYRIVLTRYGTGGSYDVKDKTIRLRTTSSGDFVRKDPAATPIHEITHLCVEHLVNNYGLSFQEKEQLVNGIDSILFPSIFDPNHEVSGEDRAKYLDLLQNLPGVLEQEHLKGA